MSKKVDEKKLLNEEDLRWVKVVRKGVDGLAAISEAHAEGCETEWMAMHYSLESVSEILDGIIADYRERLGLEKK